MLMERKCNLGILSRKYLFIPASSIADKSLFSQAACIDMIKRNCLKPENIENLVFLKTYLAYVENNIITFNQL